MAYDDDKALGFRESVDIVAIMLDINDPNIDFSSDINSYNTPKTTADSLAYDGTVLPYLFSKQQLEFGVNSFPILDSITSFPAVLKIGEDLALSASASVVFSDVVSNDVFELPPPYDDRRVNGSFWGKAIARNYFENRDALIKRGYNPYDLDDGNFQIENYVIESISGLSRKGVVSIKLTDRLFFASESKAKAPVTTDCFLSVAIVDNITSLTFIGTSFGDKARDREIVTGDTGHLIIGDEIMAYTVISYGGGSGALSIVRGQGGTVATEHDTNVSIQGCLTTLDAGVLGAENVTDFNRRLFNDFTEVGVGFIDDAKWDAEKAGDLSSFNFTNIITKPITVRKLLKDTILNSGSWMYFDTILNEIIIGGSTRFETPVISINEDDNIIQNSMIVSPQASMQKTRATIRFNKSNYAQGNDELYYRNSFQIIDGTQEGDSASGKQAESKEIISNWYTGSTTDILTASSVVQLKVNRFSVIPNKFTFDLDAKDVGDLPNGDRLWYGSIIEIYTRQLLNSNATQRATLAQVTSVTPTKTDTFKITAISYNGSSIPPSDIDLTITTDQTDLTLTNLLTTNEAREYVVVIAAGVKIRSSSTSAIAFDQGVFFTGATLKLVNQGFIVGKGGGGAYGAFDEGELDVPPGLVGGLAFNATTNVIIDNLTGLIGGGGGGGGGGGASVYFNGTSNEVGAGGGGGGGGADSGLKGLGGTPSGGGVDVPGDDGDDATFNSPGGGGAGFKAGVVQAGNGGNGGEIGVKGSKAQDGAGAAGVISIGSDGGDPGASIKENGFNVDITSGNNPNQIRGPIV